MSFKDNWDKRDKDKVITLRVKDMRNLLIIAGVIGGLIGVAGTNIFNIIFNYGVEPLV